MQYYKFINSKDIRAYLEEIGYTFTPLEAAWLVYQSRTATLKEKHAAWQEIIDTSPDSTIDWWNFCAPGESLHRFLHDYMAVERKWIEAFYEKDHAVYRYAIYGKYEEERCKEESKCVFSSAEKCLEAAKKAGSDWNDFQIRMTKYILDSECDAPWMDVYYRDNGDILSVDLWGNENEAEVELYRESFDNLWFAFPVPFTKGDILWNPADPEDDFCCGAIVVENTTPNRYAETGRKGCDTSDMNIWGYFQAPNGHLYYEVAWNYMDFEYYPPEKLVGKRRILKAMGNYMKEQIDESLLARAYHQILTEEHAKDSMPKEYLIEALRLAGLEK